MHEFSSEKGSQKAGGPLLKREPCSESPNGQQAHLLFTRTAPTTNQGVTRASKTQQRWCRCSGEIPQPTQANDHLSKNYFCCIWQRCRSIHNGDWGSSPDPGGCHRSCLMRPSVDVREPSVPRPDLPIQRMTGFQSSQHQVSTKWAKKPLQKRGLFVSKSLR